MCNIDHGFSVKRTAGWYRRFFLTGTNSLPVAVVVVAAVVPLLLARSAAIRTTLGFIIETLFFVESLFAFIEDKLGSAILTGNGFVWHVLMPP